MLNFRSLFRALVPSGGSDDVSAIERALVMPGRTTVPCSGRMGRA